ncbi:hypothetical protein Peur_039767 [Populus x canadensis]
MGSKLTRFLSQFKECSLVLEREYISATRKLKGSWPFFLKREKLIIHFSSNYHFSRFYQMKEKRFSHFNWLDLY